MKAEALSSPRQVRDLAPLNAVGPRQAVSALRDVHEASTPPSALLKNAIDETRHLACALVDRAEVSPSRLAQTVRLIKHYAVHLAGLNVPPDSFVYNNFVWCDPRVTDNLTMRKRYAEAVSNPGTFAGMIEVDALGKNLNVRVALWQKVKDTYQRICWLGCERNPQATVHLLDVQQRHFRAILPPTNHNGRWREVDAGHGGDCLFLSARAALEHRGLDRGLDAHTLRQLASQQVASDPTYDDGIRAASEDALWEHTKGGALQRIWRRVS